MDFTSLVDSGCIIVHQSLYTLFYLCGKVSDTADRGLWLITSSSTSNRPVVVITLPFLMTMQEELHAYAACYHVTLRLWVCAFGKKYPGNTKEQVALVTKTGLSQTEEMMSTLMLRHWVRKSCAMLILKAVTKNVSWLGKAGNAPEHRCTVANGSFMLPMVAVCCVHLPWVS